MLSVAPLLGQQTLDQSVFEPNTNYRAGYKPTEASQINSSTEHVFTVPQTSSNEDKGKYCVLLFISI